MKRLGHADDLPLDYCFSSTYRLFIQSDRWETWKRLIFPKVPANLLLPCDYVKRERQTLVPIQEGAPVSPYVMQDQAVVTHIIPTRPGGSNQSEVTNWYRYCPHGLHGRLRRARQW